MEGISVTIISLNEEARVRDCLESVRWADEIIVSDSGSTDATVDICRKAGAKVFMDEWLGFGPQKNLCAGRARNRWVLNIDADERVTPELRDEIIEAVARGRANGYFLPRKNYFGKSWIRYCGWYPDYTLRLYRKDKAGFNERGVHEKVIAEGLTERLKNPLLHYTYRDIPDYMARMQRYSTLSAEVMASEGREAGMGDLLLRPIFTFLKMFVLKLGFLEGKRGVIISMLYACYTFVKYAKLWEMKRSSAGSVSRHG